MGAVFAGRYRGPCRSVLALVDPPATYQQALTLAVLIWTANLLLGYINSVLVAQASPKVIALRRTTSGRNIAVAVDQPPEEGIR